MKQDPCFPLYPKLNSRQIVDLNKKGKTKNLLKQNSLMISGLLLKQDTKILIVNLKNDILDSTEMERC